MTVHIYRPSGGLSIGNRTPVDETRCRAMVDRGDSRISFFGQCSAKVKVTRKVGDRMLGFCGRHDPEAIAARERAADQARAEKEARRERIDLRRFVRPTEYRDALRAIAAGHNDARSLAAEVLAKWDDAE